MAQTLKARVQRGKEIGIELWPHRYSGGYYVASHERFERDYLRVESIEELIDHWKQGYKIRMSAPNSQHHQSPSLIAPDSIELV